MATPSAGGAPSSGTSQAVSFFGNQTLSPTRAINASSFLAGDESVTIVPSFTLPEPMELLSGTVGPFRAGMDAVVPLWLATMLRRRKLAKIVPPSWMDAEVLKGVLKFERDPNEASFSPDLPFRHAEIARAIMAACRAGSGTGSMAGDAAGDVEIPDADQIKILLEDIAAVRIEKIRGNVHQLSTSTLVARSTAESVIDVTNIGSLEMHAIKPFVAEAFRLHRELMGRGSTSNKDVEADANARTAGGSGRASAASEGRGRLRQSRLARESEAAGGEEEEEAMGEEELEEPRPLDEMEGEEDDNAGRSGGLRRHR
ncbi:hypothetical protein ACHAXT_008647 [Thalassiosira profunda]